MGDEQGTARRKPGPKRRLSAQQRGRFLEVLGQTGNRSLAAAAIGVEARLMDQRRRFDALLDREWREAVAQAERRLAGADGPLDCIGGAEPMVIRRGPGGKARIVRAGARRWSRAVEDRFFGALAVTGNIRASARAVGFSESCIAQRRRKWGDFARKMDEALENAEIVLEFRLAAEASGLGPSVGLEGQGEQADGEPLPTPQPERFDPDLALRFLKWRLKKREGGGRRGRIPAPPSIEAVTETIVRSVEAIKRHRARFGSGGGGDGDSHE